tara:strand:+ start:105 stop:740 length:636 start_codon:yes stop_codon:yes gene_type:complete
MAFQSIWYFTDLPEDIVNILDKDLADNFDFTMDESKLMGQQVRKEKRNSDNAWISSDHWISGFLWHYVNKANQENFLYDLTHIDGESLQYTRYGEGQYYNWHNDAGLSQFYKPMSEKNSGDSYANENNHRDFVSKNCEMIRKLSFSLQLSDPDDYEGGNVEFIDETDKSFIGPRQRGAIILFDSRTKHRVNKVTKGVRRSIVGWVLGPRWK